MIHQTYHGCPNWISGGCVCQLAPGGDHGAYPTDRRSGNDRRREALPARAQPAALPEDGLGTLIAPPHECNAAATIEYAITMLEVYGGNPKVIEYLRAGLDQHEASAAAPSGKGEV